MIGVIILKKYIFQTVSLFLISQISIFAIEIIFFKELSLLSYINISFYIGFLFIFSSLLFFTVKSGFFDAVTKSFRQVFIGKSTQKEEIEQMLLPSMMITFNVLPFLLNGLFVTLIMLIALSIY